MHNMRNISLFYSSKEGGNTGKGGAYFSLLAYKNELIKEYDVKIIHDNELKTTVLDGYEDIKLLKSQTLLVKVKVLAKYFKKNRPLAFFSFSGRILTIYIRFFCFLYGTKYIYIKAGGPNGQIRQYFQNTIFYNEENLKNSEKKRNLNSFLLSNRVESPIQNRIRVENFFIKHETKTISLKILRVSRINNIYYETFLATIKQHLELQKKNISVLTHLIGYIEDQDVFNKLQGDIIGIDNLFLFTEEYYTINTKELIPFYDVVVGIGRGFWEGVVNDKIVLGYCKNSSLPVLVNHQNIMDFRKNNFSTRTIVESPITFVESYENFQNEYFKNGYKGLLKKVFDDEYSSLTLLKKLNTIINSSSKENFFKIVKSYLPFKYKYLPKLKFLFK